MKVLIACESSGTVREAFRKLGHEAYSADLLPADDNSKYHIQGDALKLINNPAWEWDLIIMHPPCTHLAVSGARWFKQKRADGRQQAGIKLFMDFVNAAEKSGAMWMAENPVSIMSTHYRKPDQIIQPWQFGHGETKATCLWLGGGLTKLIPTNIVEGREARIHKMAPGPDRWKERSKTYAGIAKAMAEQWSVLHD